MARQTRAKKSSKEALHYHLIGIGGTAMASLAGLLKAAGHKVTGSDQNVYPPMSTGLEEMGIDRKLSQADEVLREAKEQLEHFRLTLSQTKRGVSC